MKRLSITIALAAMLTACGGGSDSSGSTTPAPTPVTKAKIAGIEDTIKLGQTIDLVLLSPDYPVTNVTWQQTAGENIVFHAENSKVIAFTADKVGDYSFSVNFLDNNDANQTLSYSFSVTSDVSLLAARLSHAVVEGNKVSLLTYLAESVDEASIKWVQESGPTVTFTEDSTDGKTAVFFDAPQVLNDTLVTFKVSAQAGDIVHSDLVAVLIENSQIIVITNNQKSPFTTRVATVLPFNLNSKYKDTIVGCVYSNDVTYTKSCKFSDLPLIAHDSSTPTVDDIMDHVVVSHPWMGKRFKSFLETYDVNDDFKNLLRATTAIVISYDIRPSFYQPYTGAIYLDPSDLWVTPEERDSINQAPDYRSAFGSDLQFEMPWRYVKDNDWASYGFPIKERITRSPENALYEFTSLLYHELAHANDYYPSTSWDSISLSDTVGNVTSAVANNNNSQSDQLQNVLPLISDQMWSLGQVRFHNGSVSDEQKALTTEDVAQLFKVEAAPQFYSYSSTREDYAILFDGFMMKARYGVDRDVAVSDQNYDNLVWGQRGRISDNNIKSRVEFVANRVLPEFTEAKSVLDLLDEPKSLKTGIKWIDSVELEVDPMNTVIADELLKKSKKIDARLIPLNGKQRHIIEPIFIN